MSVERQTITRRWWSRVGRAWKAAQVELQGQYSIERLCCVKGYCQRISATHSALVLTLTPLPCLLVVLAIECIPLEDPDLGVEHAFLFWVRAFLVAQIVDFLVLYQLRHLIPTLPTSNLLILASSCFAAFGAVVSAYGMSRVIGFPLPFTLLLGSPVSLALLGACAFAMWGRFFRSNSVERKGLLNYIVVVAVQVTMTYVYPAYTFAFVRLSGEQQILFSLMLPLIKLLVKNWISYRFRDKHDLKSDMVVLNADIYHSLFVSWCMNGTASTFSTVFLMVMDSAEALLALQDVNGMLKELSPILDRVDDAKTSGRANHKSWFGGSKYDGVPLLDLAMAIWEIDRLKTNLSVRKISHVQSPTEWHPSSIATVSSSRGGAKPASFYANSAKGPELTRAFIAPMPSETTDSKLSTDTFLAERRSVCVLIFTTVEAPAARAKRAVAAMSESERTRCLELVLRLMHLAEFLLLIEFVEVVIPAVYCVYLLGIYHLPNRQFFEAIRGLSADELSDNLANVAVYTLLESASFVLLNFILQWKFGISATKHLAFVLESQWHLSQSKLVLWVVFAVQSRLEHFGTDFSFQFTWLSAAH